MFTGDPNTKEPFNSWIERTLLKSEARSTARSQRQRLKNELKNLDGLSQEFLLSENLYCYQNLYCFFSTVISF